MSCRRLPSRHRCAGSAYPWPGILLRLLREPQIATASFVVSVGVHMFFIRFGSKRGKRFRWSSPLRRVLDEGREFERSAEIRSGLSAPKRLPIRLRSVEVDRGYVLPTLVSRCAAANHSDHVFAAEVLACRRYRIVGIDALQDMHEFLFNVEDIGPLHASVICFGHRRRLFMTPAMAVADGPVRNRLGIVVVAVTLLPVFRLLITGRKCEIGTVDRAPTGRVLLDEERQHGVQILLEMLAIDPKESGSKARRTSVPVVIHALERPLSGAACNTASCAHMFSSESFAYRLGQRSSDHSKKAPWGIERDILPVA